MKITCSTSTNAKPCVSKKFPCGKNLRFDVVRYSKSMNEVWLGGTDINVEVKGGSDCGNKNYNQVPIAHEFGHVLGLGHLGVRGNEESNYSADPSSLMGCGL
jgi:hypothetical protein